MALILLAEDETSTIDHVRSVLASQGWLVKTVKSRAQALRAASEFAPQLVLLNDELKGIDDLVRTFSRRSGGPGVVLLSAHEESPSDGEDVEAVLTKPVQTEALIATIKDKLSTASDKKASTDAGEDVRILSSEEIFGDLLDDILDKDIAQEAAASEPTEDPEEETTPSDETSSEEIELEDLESEEAEEEADAAEVEAETEVQPAEEDEEEDEETAADEEPAAGPDDSMMDLSDLEELAKEAVPALVDALEAQARDVGEPEEELDVAELLRETSETPSPPKPETTPAGQDMDEDLEAKLSDTLAGVLAASLGAATEPDSAEVDSDSTTDVDSLLSQALGDLDMAKPRSPDGPVIPLDVEPEEAASEEIDETNAIEPLEEVDPEEEDEPEEISDSAAEEEVSEEPDQAIDEVDSEPEQPSEPVIEFGEYSLEERIGLGGMAVVWKARRQGVEGFEKRVAIKKILPQPAENQDFVDMFIDEAKLAAQLNHKNITHIYDLGKVDDDYFIAMEYVEGQNLRQLLDAGRKRDKPLTAGLALYIASRIADALDYAHRSKDFNNTELGLVHRDVSPQNVLISYEGDIKLCDFGIAKAVSKISTTQMGALKGKLQYMSPEQAWGRSIDPRSDIFSTGTLLFEMLTGERLFTGESELAVLEAVRECETPERVIQDPAIPSRVKGLLLKALAKETDERYETAGELLGGLEELLAEFDPTPGQREMSSYVRELLDLPESAAKKSEPTAPERDTAVTEPAAEEIDDLAEPAEDLLDEAVAEEEGEGEGEEATDEEEKQRPAFLKWLSKLLPVVVLLAIGGYLVAGRLGDAPDAQDSSRVAAPQVTRTEIFRPESVEASLDPEPSDTDSQAARQDSSPQTAPPAAAQEQAAPTPEPEDPAPAEPVSQIEPEDNAVDVASDTETQSQFDVAQPSPQQETLAGTADPDLERRVEEDLQRVQELISTPEFAADGELDDGASTELIPDSTEPAATSQDLAANNGDATIQEAESTPFGQEELASFPSLDESQDVEEPISLDSENAEFETGPPLTAEGGEPPEDSDPPTESEATEPEPDLPSAPPAEEATATQPGDLVERGPGVIEPLVQSFQPPAYSEVARRVGATGTVRVAVLVDENGRVLEARLVEGLRQKVGLDEQTLEAARRATFRGATKDGVPVKMWHELAVQFQP